MTKSLNTTGIYRALHGRITVTQLMNSPPNFSNDLKSKHNATYMEFKNLHVN